MLQPQLALFALPDLPHVQPGQDIAELILTALTTAEFALQDGDVVVIAQKIVSKAEGRQISLTAVTPSAEALRVAEQVGKDPRLIELILRESQAISRMQRGVIIVRHRLGFVSANAGIDRSNVGGAAEMVLLLPEEPDEAARQVCQALREGTGANIGVIITDSHGRPFRLGTVGIALGVAGLPALLDLRGQLDLYGYRLQNSEVGLADEIAAAAGLVMGQGAEGRPVVVVRGLPVSLVGEVAHGRATDLLRPPALDLYA